MRSCTETINKIPVIRPAPGAIQKYIAKLETKIRHTGLSRPVVALHSGGGKTWLSEHTPNVIDVDKYILTPDIDDGTFEMALTGQDPNLFIIMPSGTGKSRYLRANTHRSADGWRLVDIDDIMAKLAATAEPVIAGKLENNIVDTDTEDYIRDNIVRVIKARDIIFLHSVREVPEGGKIVGVYSPGVFRQGKYGVGELPTMLPKFEEGSWHSFERVMHQRRQALAYAQPVTSYVQMFERLSKDLRPWFQLRSPEGLGEHGRWFGPFSGMTVRITKSLPAPDRWAFRDNKKFTIGKTNLDTAFPNGWADRNSGKLLLTHSPDDAKKWGGFLVGTIEYLGHNRAPYGDINRDANRKQHSPLVISLKNRSEAVAAVGKMWSRYKRLYSQDLWFDQFKLDKLRNGVIKHWDRETEIYLEADLVTWTQYQVSHDVLFQNWFMTDEIYKLKRFRSGEWDYHLAYLSDCLMVVKHISPEVYNIILTLCKTKNFTYKVFAAWAKEFSNMMKTFNNDFSPNWTLYVDWARWLGFSLRFDTEAYVDDLEKWLLSTEMSRHYINGSEAEFLDEFEVSLERILSEVAEPNDHSVDEFLDSPHLWAVSGSARGMESKPVMTIDGKPTPVKLTKRSAGFLGSHEELKKLFYKIGSDNYIFDKVEPVRNRPVVNSEMGMFLKMSYVEKQLKQMIGKEFEKASPIFDKFDYMADKTYQVKHIGDRVCLPLDQSGFERQTSLDMVDRIVKVAIRHTPSEDIESIKTWERIGRSIRHSVLHFPGTRVDGQVCTNGLSSGWKFTAIFNTLINLAEADMCSRLTGVKMHNLNALGDDTRMWLDAFSDGKRVLAWYKRANIKINDKLAIISKNCDEFLRKVTELVDGRQIHGYANRMVVSICYRNPKSREPDDVLAAIETALSNWMQLFSRIGDPETVGKLEPLLYADVDAVLANYGITNVNHQILHTPRSEGGFGVSHLTPGGPSLAIKYAENRTAAFHSERTRQILNNLVRKYRLRDKKYDLDPQFSQSMYGELARKKITQYEYAEGYEFNSKNFVKRLQQKGNFLSKMATFGDELIQLLNSRGAIRMEKLPFQRGDFIPNPKGKMGASGFFSSIYDNTPQSERRDLFSNPEVYDWCLRSFGVGRTRLIVFKGITWTEFQHWKYDSDFFNLVQGQFTMFYLKNGLFRRVTSADLALFLEKYMPIVMQSLNFTVRS
jgi:hypothetical protein